jgi:hypothetical protein
MRKLTRRGFAAAFFTFAALSRSAVRAEEEESVGLLLVLAADISRSLDAAKFKLQREGYAAGITNPRVIAAIQSTPNSRIAVCFVEWSGATAQAVVVDWTPIANADQAKAFAQQILAAPRLFHERTSISAAIDYAMQQFSRSTFKAERRVIDISGDGTNNSGRDVAPARDDAVARDVTINGVAILSEVPLPSNPQHTHPPGGLLKYYEDNVIGGPGAFALPAENFEAFGQSLLSKLIKEIAGAPGPSQA